MKKLSLISILLGLLFSAISAEAGRRNSDSTSIRFKNSVSLNFSEPMIRMLSKNAPIDSSYSLRSPILYYGRQRTKMLYRVGARLTMRNTNNKSDLYIDKKNVIYNRYEASLSALRIRPVSGKIHIGYGLGASGFGLWDQKIFDSGFDKVTFDTHAWSAALGPQLLLQYNINSRLSLFTEYLLAYQLTTSYTGKKFSAFPDENYANEKYIQHGFQFDYPISIYITYHF